MRAEAERLGSVVGVLIDGSQVVNWSGRGITADAELAATSALLPAMASGTARLEIIGEISPTLEAGMESLQAVFGRWLDASQKVELVVTTADRAVQGNETAVFFSGGVDSFHAVQKHRDDIDRLVYVEGFDVPAHKPSLERRVRTSLRHAAELLELPLTILRTDLRLWSEPLVGWHMYHGAALATAAHLLRNEVDRVIIPSSAAYDELYPWGSHPLTDPLWSGGVEIVHSGAEVSRTEKTQAIIHEPAAQQALRVCYENPNEAYNCGRCEKCLRTMTTLAACGACKDFHSFPDTLTPQNIAKLSLRNAQARRRARSSIEILAQQGARQDLQDAWQKALDNVSLRERTKHRLRQVARLRHGS